MIRPQLTLDLHSEMIVDNFAGGGGASTGIEMALGRCVDIAINHDPEALALHEANHPQTKHLPEDVWKVDPLAVTNGRPVGFAWFSPDCKHFSKAKGGKPRSKKIRGLAWVMVKWATLVRPRVMVLENVEEFKTWGPLLDDGSPCPKRKGKTYRSFVAQLRRLGYQVEDRELRACDYGAPTIRKRLFLIARCDGEPIVWPEPTHGNPNSAEVKAGKLLPWRTAAECIDWSIPCPSIFERSRPLADATMRRIARGIQKFVINAAKPFIVKVNHSGCDHFRGQDLGEPLQTITAKHGWGLATPFVSRFNSEKRESDAPRGQTPEEPLSTQDTQNRFAVVAPTIVGAGGPTYSAKPKPVDEPANTLTTENHAALVSAFLAKHQSERHPGEIQGASVEAPAPTVKATDSNAVVAAHLIRHFGASTGQPADEPAPTVLAGVEKTGVVAATLVGCGGRAGQSRPRGIDEPTATGTSKADACLVTANLAVQTTGHSGGRADEPLKTIATGGHHSLVTSNLAKLKGTCRDGQPTDEPLHTVQAGGNHYAEVRAFLIKYYGEGGQDQDCREPMHTIPTKDRIGLVTIEGEEYLISDIGMRMLKPHELYTAQGFPAGYIIAPIIKDRRLPKHAQVRMCGNSVCPPLARAITAANVPELSAWKKGERAA